MPPTIAEGPWWFHGVFVYDGTCEELGEFFEKNILDLDRATGAAVHLSAIGDPKIAGREYERRRTDQTIERQAQSTTNYQRLVAERGNPDHHRRLETDAIIERVGVNRNDLPCVVFLTSPAYHPPPILRIDRRWLWSPGMRVALRDAIVRHLAEVRILGFGRPRKTTTAELATQLVPVLDSILAEMDFVESAEAAKGKVPRSVTRMPVPLGASWAQVQIRFVDGHTADVTVPGKRATLTHEQMGFVDRRSGRPDKQWELLVDFAAGHGACGWGLVANRRRYEKRVQELTRKLKLIFRLKAPPFKLEPKNRRWRACFSILPDD